MITLYGKPEIESVLTRGAWESWDEVLHWLEDEGPRDSTLARSTVRAMTEDFIKLKLGGEPFTDDADALYKLVSWMRSVTHCPT